MKNPIIQENLPRHEVFAFMVATLYGYCVHAMVMDTIARCGNQTSVWKDCVFKQRMLDNKYIEGLFS